jgi:hypothetical protein
VRLHSVYDFIGTLFLNALKMIIVPLIISSIIVGVAGVGGTHGLGRLGAKTMTFYILSSLAAIVTGLLFVNAIAPGIVEGRPALEVLGLNQEQAAAAAEKVGEADVGDLAGVFLSMVPPNVVAAAANGQMLGLIFFSLLFGFFITRISEAYAEAQYNFWQGLFEIMMQITNLIMKFAPIGVFGLVAKVVAEIDNEMLDELFFTLGSFVLAVVLALATHVFITLPLVLRTVARVNPLRMYRSLSCGGRILELRVFLGQGQHVSYTLAELVRQIKIRRGYPACGFLFGIGPRLLRATVGHVLGGHVNRAPVVRVLGGDTKLAPGLQDHQGSLLDSRPIGRVPTVLRQRQV